MPAISASDVWAVGYYNGQMLLEHWDGTACSIVPGPNPSSSTYSHLSELSLLPAGDIWAVGHYRTASGGPLDVLILHWDGATWSIVPGLGLPGSWDRSLQSTVAISANEVWAAGSYSGNSEVQGLIISHMLLPCPSATPAPTSTPCTLSFSDVHAVDYFYTAVQYLVCHGVVSGYSDGTFRPYNHTTRGQLSKIMVLAEGWPINTSGGPHFSDVLPGSAFYDYVETAYNHSVVSGYADGTFRWGNNVTRGQLSKVVVISESWPIDLTGAPHFSDVPQGSPFYSFVETAYNRGVVSGYSDGTFQPGNSATRGQISKMVYLAIAQPRR